MMSRHKARSARVRTRLQAEKRQQIKLPLFIVAVVVVAMIMIVITDRPKKPTPKQYIAIPPQVLYANTGVDKTRVVDETMAQIERQLRYQWRTTSDDVAWRGNIWRTSDSRKNTPFAIIIRRDEDFEEVLGPRLQELRVKLMVEANRLIKPPITAKSNKE